LREGDVLGDGEVREERRLLRGIRDAAITRREVREVVLFAVFFLSNEFGFCVAEQTGEGAKDGALSAAGGAEDDGPIAGQIEVDVEREGSEGRAELEAVVMPELRRGATHGVRR
jgi:hypothetical protein